MKSVMEESTDLLQRIIQVKPEQSTHLTSIFEKVVEDNIKIDVEDVGGKGNEDEEMVETPPVEMSMFASVLPETGSLYFRNLRDIENTSVYSIRNGKICNYRTDSKMWKPLASSGSYYAQTISVPGQSN
jgi:hypothetical protein